MLQEAEDGQRRQRTYLVATDISEEAAHALEWTIGTVLRDGDTLLAVYAVDEELGTGRASEGEGVGVGEGASAVKDHATIVGSLTTQATQQSPLRNASPSPLGHLAPDKAAQSATPSPDSRGRSKAEQERIRATEDITQRCVRLLRKTRLQVRVVIEVIHCKSPKHLITEIIDFIEPTLVILGSRGRSALKGYVTYPGCDDTLVMCC
jgi:nucleotide-binding universal stress UspA family protein